jgi:hypothetical protein
MKLLALLFFILISYSICAQKPIFVRVYDLTGKKIDKGHVLAISDSSLQLKNKKAQTIIAVRTIGLIKTKRSAGNNLLTGSLIGASALAVVVAVGSTEPDAIGGPTTAGEGFLVGLAAGLPAGAVIGSLTIPFKNSKTFFINGDLMKWKTFQTFLSAEIGE